MEEFVTVTVKIHKDVLRDLRSQMGARMLAQAAYGLADGFIGKMLNEIEAGKTEIEMRYKTKEEKA